MKPSRNQVAASMLGTSVIIALSMQIVTGEAFLNEELAKERKCFVPEKNKELSVDFDWVLSNSNWYFPLMSKLELYRTSWDLLRKPMKEITETELEASCLRAEWSLFSPIVYGFNGKEMSYDFTPMSETEFVFTAPWRNGDGGKMYILETDNKSYILLAKCWDDTEMTWTVMSTTKTLKEEVKSKIINAIKALGFLEKGALLAEPKFEANCKHEGGKTEL